MDSAVIQLKMRDAPPVAVRDEAFFFRVVKSAFGQRRKTAVNSLSAGLARPKPEIAAALEAIGVPADARAETFTLAQFAALADALNMK